MNHQTCELQLAPTPSLPEPVIGEKITIRPLRMNDVNERYLGWLNDPEVVRFTESRFRKHTLLELQKYLSETIANATAILFAIIENSTGKHIGNIKLGAIDWNHRKAEVGILIGDKSCWGKGYAQEAISLLSVHSFERLKLHKILAGCYANNVGSIRAFEKAGFEHSGTFKNHWFCEGQWIDGYQLTLTSNRVAPVTFTKLEKIAVKSTLGTELYAWMTELFPICRSLTGPGNLTTLKFIQKIAPFQIQAIPSGTTCFDWTVPDEWAIRDAYIKTEDGKRIVDFNKSNLHVVGYSTPFQGQLALEELRPRLHTLPESPDAIPYLTSYYKPYWGFCLSHREFLKLKEGKYEVCIDSSLTEGSMHYADLILPGKSTKEVLLSSYICHPSMANNELSGPVILTAVARWLLARTERRYTYRFLLAPETIGSIAYLSKHYEQMVQNTIAGYVLTCIGDPGRYSYLKSRRETSLSDRVGTHWIKHRTLYSKIYEFSERGSDERQFCWPGIDLPIGSLMRTRYGEYPQYHSSLDNLELVTPEALEDSFRMVTQCLEAIEHNRIYQATTLCEPQLGKRGLYPSLSTRESGKEVALLSNLLTYSDGKTDLLAIAEKIHSPIWELIPLVERCIKNGVLKEVPSI